MAAFETYVKRIYAANPSGNTVVDSGQPLMENVSAGCRQLGRICEQYADAIDDCRHTLIAVGVGAGIITVAGVLLTVFTFGGSDVAAAAGDAALAAEAAAAAAAETLAAAEAELAAVAAVAEAEAVITAALARLTAAGVITAAAVAGTAGSASASPVLAGLPAAIPAIVPPLPPGPPSGAYPPYSPQQLAVATGWAGGLPTRDPVYGTPDDIAYQVRVAGQPERRMLAADGEAKWADGYRPSDGAVIDAKHVRDPGCSPRTLQGLNEGNFASLMLRARDEGEVTVYSKIIANPANHSQYLEIPTNDEQSVGYWQYLAAQQHVPSDVRYIP